MRHLLFAICAAVVVLPASEARGGVCTPGQNSFTDLPDSSPFCTEALWMRNAVVTIGCGNGTIYCGADPVTRGQMALFMKRLVRAVTPDIVHAAFASTGDIDTGLATCITAPYTIPSTGANYRLLLSAIGGVSFVTNGPADVFVSVQMSTNGLPFSQLVPALRASVPANQWTSVPVLWSQTITGGSGHLLVPGSSYQWRLVLQRASFDTTGDVIENRCSLMITLPPDATVL